MTHKKYKIINTNAYSNYIEFELNGLVEFSNGKHNFIFCINEAPFKNYQVGDEVEIDLTRAKHMVVQSYHQEIVKKTSRNWENYEYEDYNWNETSQTSQPSHLASAQKQKSLHKMKIALDTFYNVLEPLEEYIEKAGNYPNFRNKRQIYRKNIQDSEGTLENDEDLFLSNLYIFAITFHGKPEFFMKVIQEDFYKWIDAVGITSENTSEELKHFLIEINNILEGKDEKIIKESRERNKNVEIDPKEIVGIFAGIQNPLNKNRWQRKELEGKKWNEIPEEDRLKGDVDLGKQEFEKIERSVFIPHQNFRLRYFGEKRPTNEVSSMEGIQQRSSSPAVNSSATRSSLPNVPHLNENGELVIDGEIYESVGENSPVCQEDVNNIRYQQQFLDQTSQVLVATSTGFVALVAATSVKFFKKSLR
ncbi:MAG: hypothetical protein MRERC_12c003 [Mycoplasmataceae bacterium RC_NB112A]|nr:MAG: hypothetical protein MRERC_12c003 [Mycoplasmataceae bacterium RC_NB112A]